MHTKAIWASVWIWLKLFELAIDAHTCYLIFNICFRTICQTKQITKKKLKFYSFKSMHWHDRSDPIILKCMEYCSIEKMCLTTKTTDNFFFHHFFYLYSNYNNLFHSLFFLFLNFRYMILRSMLQLHTSIHLKCTFEYNICKYRSWPVFPIKTINQNRIIQIFVCIIFILSIARRFSREKVLAYASVTIWIKSIFILVLFWISFTTVNITF